MQRKKVSRHQVSALFSISTTVEIPSLCPTCMYPKKGKPLIQKQLLAANN